jgi:hypothetical protein
MLKKGLGKLFVNLRHDERDQDGHRESHKQEKGEGSCVFRSGWSELIEGHGLFECKARMASVGARYELD